MLKIRLSLLALASLLAVQPTSALTLAENFTTDPAGRGWQAFGDTNLFQWSAANQNLAVTWDSTKPNSYFHHPLGMTMTSASNFMFSVDFTLQDIAIGTTPGKPQALQVAIGLQHHATATNGGFIIGTGFQAPNLVELNYFPDSGFGAAVTTPMISSANNFAAGGFTVPLELVPGVRYHAVLVYTAANQTLTTTLTSNGVPIGPIQASKLTATFGDFAVDTLAIASYSDEGQDTNEYEGVVYAGSLRAHGTVEKIAFASPLPIGQITAPAPGGVQFASVAGWNYVLERSVNLRTWTPVTAPTPGGAGPVTLTDTNPPAGNACYRVRAELP
jgi:hypothetical protein